jgi:hypothetical protein
MNLLRAAALSAALCLTAAAPAAADSLRYIKDGNVWAANADGSNQTQITKTGGYFWVSQADDGTMITLVGGEKLRKLSPTGAVLAEFGTYVSDGLPTSGPVTQFHGPFEPQISPDGALVAFEWMNDSYYGGNTPTCSESSVPSCYEYKSSQGVGITHSDRFTNFDEYGLLTGWIAPSWMAKGWLLRSGANVSPNEDTVFNAIGPGKGDDEMKRWFWDDDQGLGVDDVEMAADESFSVGVAGFYDELLRFYRPVADPYNAPKQSLSFWEKNTPAVERCFQLENPKGNKFRSPTIAPDGRGAAYVDDAGVHVVVVPDVKAACAPADESKLLIPGATSPDWGPVNVPAIPADNGGGNGGGGGGNVVVDPPKPGTSLTAMVTKTSLKTALRKGLKVKVVGAGAGRVDVGAFRGKGRVGGGTATAKGGSATVKVLFTAKARRSLARKRSVALTLKVSTTTPAAKRTLKVTLGGARRGR